MMAGAEVGDGEGGVDGDEVECLIANAIYKVGFADLLQVLCSVLLRSWFLNRKLLHPPGFAAHARRRQPFATHFYWVER
jgi:hypothetical protein